MADKKISQLTGATTPLAGTEVLPVVQSGSTVKVAVSDLTAGRAVSASSLSLTGSPLPTGSGGTGLTSFTAGRVVYATNSSTLSTSGQLRQDGTNASLNTASSAWNTFSAFEIGSPGVALYGFNGFSDVGLSLNLYYNSGWKYGQPGRAAGLITMSGDGDFFVRSTATTGSAGDPASTLADKFVVGVSGNATISNGNLVVGTAGKGIDFSANTHAAGMTSELLDWYEEGTFTPTLQGSTGNPTPTYTTQLGTYTRIGNIVYVWIQVYTSAVSGGTGDLRIGDLPFSTNASYGARFIVTCTRVDFSATATYVNAAVDASSNKIYLIETNDNSNDTVVPISAWNAGAAAGVSISGFYFV